MLTILVALHCEAKPLIDAYRLKKACSYPFDHYKNSANEGLNIDLVITGVGASAMATAVGWVAAVLNVKSPVNQRIWLNIGTAGHFNRALGSLFLVHGVGDEIQQKCHYPPMVAKWKGASDAVLSMSAPCTQYPEGAAVDMEAYAFFISALRFSHAEYVQALKVVSDNQESGIEHLNAAKLTGFMAMNLSEIIEYIDSLLSITRSEFEIDFDLDKLLQLKGTHSHRLQVKDLIQKLSVINHLDNIVQPVFACDSLKQVLVILREELNLATPVIIKKVGVNG